MVVNIQRETHIRANAHVQSPSEDHVYLHGCHAYLHLSVSGSRLGNHQYNERLIHTLCRHILPAVCDRLYHQLHPL
jgi:hypothetical protein